MVRSPSGLHGSNSLAGGTKKVGGRKFEEMAARAFQ